MGAGGMPDPLAVLQHVPGVIVVVDADGVVRWVNDAMTEVTGYDREDLLGTNMLDHLDLDWNPLALESIAYAMANPGMRLPTLLRFHTRLGRPVVMEVTANNQFDHPRIGGLVVHLRPSDERHLLDQILESFAAGAPLEETLRTVHAVAAAETLRSACAVVLRGVEAEAAQTVLASSPDVAALTGEVDASVPWGRAAAIEQPVILGSVDELPGTLAGPARAAGFEACWSFPVARAEAEAVDAVIVLWRREPGPPEPSATMVAERLVRLCSLVFERAEHSRALQEAATHDPLTGLPDRAVFFDAVERLLPDGAGVLYLDLDGFKPINDRWGHDHGDRVLVAVAERLRAAVRPEDAVARLGGDEFAVVLSGADLDALSSTAQRLLTAVGSPIVALGRRLEVGATIGAAACDDPMCTPDELVAAADRALLDAKAEAKGTWRLGTCHP